MSAEKIRPTHRERAAYVYIRQSTLQQVRHHQESQRRQYELQQLARELGFAQVLVIDDDLGVSGSGSKERPGFGRLLTAVCEGKVGGVLALEASRLARNNRDWHHLIDLCVLTDTLVIDGDGVYDPRQLNDRLVLGLKGTMSEFELGLLRQRAQEALRQKIQRGEVLTEVPVGYVRTEANGIEMTPIGRCRKPSVESLCNFDGWAACARCCCGIARSRFQCAAYKCNAQPQLLEEAFAELGASSRCCCWTKRKTTP